MKNILAHFCITFLFLLFVYTSASKFLDYDKFVFQMHLAPVPLMKVLAPLFGWLIPCVETIIAIAFAVGFFIPSIKIKSLYASVILLSAFEFYIVIMLLSGSQLPCTCGGIVSQMGWKQHLFFNGFLIVTSILSIRYLKNHTIPTSSEHDKGEFKELSRA